MPPIKLILAELAFSVPEVMVKSPAIEWVSADPRFNVPPVPFNIRLPMLTFPLNVATPAVLVMVILPVVENPAIL